MNKYLLLFAFLACYNTVIAQKNYKVFAVGFYNVENLFHPENDTTKLDEDFTPNGDYHYTYEVYNQKLHNIAMVLSKMGTDVTPDGAAIVGIAEIENDLAIKDLLMQPELKERNYQYVWHPTPDVRGISTAFLYNPKYFRLLSSTPLYVDLRKVGQERPTRNVLYIKGIFAGGDTVHIMVNHWPSRSGGESETMPHRAVAAGVDKRIVDSLMAIDQNTKILIMGDLNDNPTDASVIKVLKAKADTANVTLTDIYNPWIKIYKSGRGTEIFQGQWNLLDQIMLSGAFLKNNNNKWKYLKTQIFKKEFIMHSSGPEAGYPHRSFTIDRTWDNGYSDHFPTLVYLVQ
jgi:endonuclease/exonuclease/phosphatase family metal-dependent hydrolase